MTSTTRYDESFVERDEVLFPNADVIDVEPHYDNFTAIQNALQQYDESQQMHTTATARSYSTADQYRAIRAQVESVPSSHQYYSNENLYMNLISPSITHIVPLQIRSKKIDGHVFNLTQIVQDIGYDRNTPFMRASPSPPTKNVSALLNIVLKMGGAHGPLVNIWRSRIDDDYFQRWYLEKYHQRSASLIQHNTMNNISEKTTQNTQARAYQSSITMDNVASNEQPFRTEIQFGNGTKQVYRYEDQDVTSPTSSQSSYSEIELKPQHQRSASLTSILKKSPNPSPSQSKHRVTIRDHNSMEDVTQRTISSSTQRSNEQKLLADYQRVIESNPDVHNDPNPEMITKPSPNPVTYQQNVTVRYLVPPTPPPPGPLIIREIVPPRAPTPPPLVVKYQQPSPPTPPPLILREAPPPPPPHQETTVITKVLPAEPQPARRVIVEHVAPSPAKPQQVIIEKWLPYKPAPPREVIYQQVTEKSATAELEQAAVHIDRQRRHSAEFQSSSTRVPIPIQTHRRNSADYAEREHFVEQYQQHQLQQQQQQQHRRNSADYAEQEHFVEQYQQHQQQQQQHHHHQQQAQTFNQLAWNSHQQILAMQQRSRQQVQAHQQWAANQWQQHAANMYVPLSAQLTTPSLIVYHPPVATSYVQTQEYRQVQYTPTYTYQYY